MTVPGRTASEVHDAGIQARRDVLGEEHVARSLERATPLGKTWLDHAHSHAWNVWTRDGLDRRTRRVITLSCLIALGLEREVALHTRAALADGVTPEEVVELVIHTSVYVGFPKAHEALAAVESTLRDLGATQ